MPTLPLPSGSGIYGGDLPVVDESDVDNIVPAFLKTSDPSPVKDAIIAALTVMMQTYQEDSAESVALNDVIRSVDYPLSGLGEDRGVPRQGQSDAEYRKLILNIQNGVTPEAIMAAVNSILAPQTPILAQYLESVQDRLYIGDSNPRGWHSYIWDTTMSMSPGYSDRLYPDDAPNHLGYFRPQSNPGGARLFNDTIGRLFFIRIPNIADVNDLGSFIFNSLVPGVRTNLDTTENRIYIGLSGVASGIRSIPTTLLDTFNSIVTVVNRIKGSGIRFVLYMDPKLTS